MVTDLQPHPTYSNDWMYSNRAPQAVQYEPQDIVNAWALQIGSAQYNAFQLNYATDQFVESSTSSSTQLQRSLYCPENMQTSAYSCSSYSGGYLQSQIYQHQTANGYNPRQSQDEERPRYQEPAVETANGYIPRLPQEPAVETKVVDDFVAADT